VKKKIVIPLFFALAVINTIITGLWISDIRRKMELLNWRYESALNLDSSLYDNTFLKIAISKLEEKIFIEKALKRKEGDAFKMTEDVLRLLEQNRIRVINYHLEGEENREELSVTAEGDIGSVLKLIYKFSSSKEEFRINFVSVDARVSGRPATLVIRITYA
jgi:hypothetical protein